MLPAPLDQQILLSPTPRPTQPASPPDSISFLRPVLTSSRILSDEPLAEMNLPRNSTEIVQDPISNVTIPQSTQSNKKN